MFKIVCNVDKLAWGDLIAHVNVVCGVSSSLLYMLLFKVDPKQGMSECLETSEPRSNKLATTCEVITGTN